MPSPNGLAIAPDGKIVYVVDHNDGEVFRIDAATNTAGSPITVGQNSYAIAITPDGKTAHATNANNPGSVTPVDLATFTASTAIPVGDNALGHVCGLAVGVIAIAAGLAPAPSGIGVPPTSVAVSIGVTLMLA